MAQAPDKHDTIFALSSGRPPAAVAVVRISGPRASDALQILTGKVPPPRQAALVRVRDAKGGDIDQALALWFPSPASETGENMAELQLHGGRAVVEATLGALGKLRGLRPAEAGEFTRRAFENGKLDLTAVEGLADLVMAETEAQRRAAFRQMTGALRERAETWRGRLIAALALVEARIDFADEADVPQDLLTPASRIAGELAAEIAVVLTDSGHAERLREGLTVAIAGPPNVGKSTLLNRLARREAAIVSPYAGTTRDVIEIHLDLGGYPVTVLDTAGIRDTDDPIELEGVRRARERANGADLVLWLSEATFGHGARAAVNHGSEADLVAREAARVGGGGSEADINAAINVRGSAGATAGPESAPATGAMRPNQVIWQVETKIDALGERNESRLRNNEPKFDVDVKETFTVKPHASLTKVNELITGKVEHRNELEFNKNESQVRSFQLSCKTGEGLDALVGALTAYARQYLGSAEQSLITRVRHRHGLEQTLAALRRAVAPSVAGQEDLMAEELRFAAATLGRLTGRVDVEDILDAIFRDFCIGK